MLTWTVLWDRIHASSSLRIQGSALHSMTHNPKHPLSGLTPCRCQGNPSHALPCVLKTRWLLPSAVKVHGGPMAALEMHTTSKQGDWVEEALGIWNLSSQKECNRILVIYQKCQESILLLQFMISEHSRTSSVVTTGLYDEETGLQLCHSNDILGPIIDHIQYFPVMSKEGKILRKYVLILIFQPL